MIVCQNVLHLLHDGSSSETTDVDAVAKATLNETHGIAQVIRAPLLEPAL